MGNRLPGHCYKAVFDDARAIRGRFCVAYVGGTAAEGDPLAGVIATKKTFRRAHARNRAKRLMREAFRQEAPGLPAGFRCILIARARMRDGETAMQDVQADLKKILARPRADAADRRNQTSPNR